MSGKKGKGAPVWLRPVLLSLAGGILACFLLLCAFALLGSKLYLSVDLFAWFDTVSVCLGGFVSAKLLAQQRKSGGLACGLAMFAFYFFALMAAGLAAGYHIPEMHTIIRAVGLLIGCMCGGMLGIRHAEKAAHRHHAG